MSSSHRAPRAVGRYLLYNAIASGGMATVHFGRMEGAAGFARVVAIKRLHPHHVEDAEFSAMLLDEARLAARVHHPNVVQTLDVVSTDGKLFIVMEYVHGDSLARLMSQTIAAKEKIPLGVVSAIVAGFLRGLHAAHEATTEHGEPLHIVHRDVSPQNVIVGVDGLARVLDFGIAKASVRQQSTREGQLKGKLAYMAPEQLRRGEVTRRTDVYSASIVLWEALTGRRLFKADNEGAIIEQILLGMIDPPSKYVPSLPVEIDDIVLRGLARDPEARFATARDMAAALEACTPPSLASEVGAWAERIGGVALRTRADQWSEIERAVKMETLADTAPSGARAKGARRLWAIGIAGGAALTLGIVGLWIAIAPQHEPVKTIESATRENEIAPGPLPIPAGSITASAPDPDSGTSSVMAAPSTTHTQHVRTRPANDCAIPFTIGADGSKIYKRNCLH